jgi:hypothetical protein
VSDWHRRRVEAAAQAMAGAGRDADPLAHAGNVLRAADGAVGGVVPQEEYQQLALDYSAWRVRALQDETLLERTLEALDVIAAAVDGPPDDLRNRAFATAVEVRAMLDARRDARADEDEPG